MIKKITLSFLLIFAVIFSCACGGEVRADFKNNLYEITTPPYKSINRKALKPLSPITQPRYIYDQTEGVYKNPNAEITNAATLHFVGDLMCQTRQQTAAYDKKNKTYNFNSSFDYVKPIFSDSDLVVGNLETMLCQNAPFMSEQNYIDGGYHLNAPATYLDALKYAGFDLLSMANNHNADTGYHGIKQTNEHVDSYGFMRTGLFSSSEEKRYLVIDINGIKIGFLSYAIDFSAGKDKYFNWFGKNILLNVFTKEKAEKDIAAARADGAEFILTYIHFNWNYEYRNVESASQRLWSKQLADAGADYIVGGHPHALQRYDILTTEDNRQVPVIYSIGNFVSHMTKKVTKESIILRLTLKRAGDSIIIEHEDYIPLKIETKYNNKNYVVIPTVAPYNNNCQLSDLTNYNNRIKSLIGDKLNMVI